MDDIYNDLENYDDVGLVNELRSENTELKQKLAQCNSSMEILQKDFDKLSAEFKTLETNYSSLLKIAREEIKRKTTMITNLNIEKDMLVIKAAQTAPPNKVQNLLRNVVTESRQQNKKWKKRGPRTPEKADFNRNDNKRPPSSDTSSTTIENPGKMLTKDRNVDSVKSSYRIPTKVNDSQNNEMFPDRRGHDNKSPANAVDRRLMALARPQFSKLSSDEEFEDMYSALEPKTPSHRESEKSRKRERDRSQEDKSYNSSISQDKPNYADQFRDRFVKNKTSRFSEGDRNMKRDKPYPPNDRNMNRDRPYHENDRSMNRDRQYNENDRNMNRDMQYNESDRHFHREKYVSPYRKSSPEKQRRGREFGDDRYLQQYDRHRVLESPPRERFQHRSRERRPFHEREDDTRGPQRQDTYRYNHPDSRGVKHRSHSEYDEPQNKRPRIDSYSNHQDERRPGDRQYHKEIPRNCQSPDFSHTDYESSNDPIPEIRSTASTVMEDPRIKSNKYVKTTVGDMEVLQTANKNKIDLQPVNKSLWNLQVVDVPQALKSNPLEISEELIDKLYADTNKPSSIISMESGEIGSKTPDALWDDLSDHSDFNDDLDFRYKGESSRKSRSKKGKRKNRDRSPIDKTLKDISHDTDIVQKKSNSEKGPNKSKADKEEKSKKSPTDKQSEKTDKSSILHRLILSATVESEETENLSKVVKKLKEVEQSAQDKEEIIKTKGPTKTSPVIENPSISQRQSLTDKSALSAKCVLSSKDETCLPSKDKKEGRKSKAATETEKHYTTENPRVSNRRLDSVIDKSESANNRKTDKDLIISSLNKKEDRKSKGATKMYSNNTEQPSISKIINAVTDNVEKTDHHRKDDDEALVITPERKKEERKNMGASNAQRDTTGQSEKAACHKSEENKANNVAVNKDKAVDKLEKMIDDSRVDETPTVALANTNTIDTNMSCCDSETPSQDRPKQKSMEGDKHDSLDLLKTTEKETESSVLIFHDLEHRVYSTRHIVEGDLQLSDDSNDEKQPNKDEKIQEKKKHKSKRKSHRETSKEKPVELEDTTIKTRSKKEKEKIKPQNKFTELFGDSSSLITPEELNLATREAHEIIADRCPLVCEDAQDGITSLQIQTVTNVQNNSESKVKCSNSTILEDKLVTKDSKNRTHPKKHKGMDDVTSKDAHKSKKSCNDANLQKVDRDENQSVAGVKLVLSSEKLKEMQSAKITTDVNKSDLSIPTDKSKVKDLAKISKKSKNKHEKKSPASDPSVELNVNIPCSTLGTNSNKALGVGDNKENASCNDNLEKQISGEMAKIFEDTVVPSKAKSVDSSKIIEEKLQANEKVIETSSSIETQSVLNLVPVTEEPSVKTVVISTGIQHLDPKNVHLVTPLALATSTPAREISEPNTSEIEPKLNHTARVNVTIASEDSVSQSETDAPDMRIHCYRRRRKVLKR